MSSGRTEQIRPRRGSNGASGDSGYGDSVYSRNHRQRSNSRNARLPPSSYHEGYSTHNSRSTSSRRDDRSNSASRSVREQSYPPSPRGGYRSSQTDEYFMHWQHGVERENRPPGSSGHDRYSQRDDQSTYERHNHREPHPASDNLDGDRNNQSNGDPVYERSNPGGPTNSFRGGGYQDIPHGSHFDNNETSAPMAPGAPGAPEHQEGLSRRQREYSGVLGKGMDSMIEKMTNQPERLHAVSMTITPETMEWKMKTQRLCALCSEYIGRERFYRCTICKHDICDECKAGQRSCLYLYGHRFPWIPREHNLKRI